MIPFIDLATQQKVIYSKIERRIQNVLSHGQYIMGPEINELEKELGEYSGLKNAITCSSGTDALLLALMAFDIGPGDAIFTTPFTFIATAEVIALLGATPIFVDIDTKSFNIDSSKLELAIRAVRENDPVIYPLPKIRNSELTTRNSELNPKGIIAVDLFGLPADYDSVNRIPRDQGLFVLEDAAQSFGATYKDKKPGTLADMAATRFFPAKPLGCYGGGGAVLTDNDDLAEIIKSIRSHGKGKEKYDNIRIGVNGRMDTLQAAILLAKLEIFPSEIESRNRIAQRYSSGLDGAVKIPYVPPESVSAWAQYSILPEFRLDVQAGPKNEGIPTAIYYPKSLHMQTAFEYLGYKKGDFPISEETSENILSLPMHPYLKDDQVDKVIEIITGVVKNKTNRPLFLILKQKSSPYVLSKS